MTVKELIQELQHLVKRSPEVADMRVAVLRGDPVTYDVIDNYRVVEDSICFTDGAQACQPPFLTLE